MRWKGSPDLSAHFPLSLLSALDTMQHVAVKAKDFPLSLLSALDTMQHVAVKAKDFPASFQSESEKNT